MRITLNIVAGLFVLSGVIWFLQRMGIGEQRNRKLA
jgi:hypothetical protein